VEEHAWCSARAIDLASFTPWYGLQGQVVFGRSTITLTAVCWVGLVKLNDVFAELRSVGRNNYLLLKFAPLRLTTHLQTPWS